MSRFGQRVFRDVEAAQGRAFLSDAIAEIPDELVVRYVRGALREARRVVRILERHLREYEEEITR